jgi:DNA-binding IclR family transcriptional regulator
MTVSRAGGGVDAGPETGVGVLDRCVQILRAVDAGVTTAPQLISSLGLSRSTGFRLVKALETHGLLRFERGAGYRLGPLLHRLGMRAAGDLPLADLARPVLERLTEDTGESSQLYVRFDDVRVCVAAVESPNELRTIVAVGAELPLARGSAGKALLVSATTADRERFAREAADPERFGPQLRSAERRGWAQSAEERERGVGSVSAPVRGPSGDVVAAVSVSGPVGRMRGALARRYAPAVMTAAREIERLLHGAAAGEVPPGEVPPGQVPPGEVPPG